MAFTSEQNINISVDKTTVGITAGSTDFNKLLTDNFNVTVSTNNSTGYVLNMAVDSSATNGATIVTEESGFEAEQLDVATNALVNTANNRHYVPSITSSITNPTDSTFPVNSWAYSISSTPANMVYNPLPTAGSSAEIKKVTELDFPTDGSKATADDVTPVTVATKADMTIPAGTYTNKLVFTAITNYNPEYDNYTIIYNKNGTSGDGTSGTIGGDMSMVSHSVYTGDSITLYAPNYWRTGYGFLGWFFTPNATKYVPSTQASLNTGEAYVYGPNESITITDDILNNANTDKAIQIYAIWKASEGNLQNWTGCNSMNIGDVTALTDTRDNNVYTIAKLADSKCWFAENLRLDNTATIDSTNTNNPASGFALGSSNTDEWCVIGSSACVDQSLWNNINSSDYYAYGNYFNWFSATAGNGTYSMTSGNTAGDICPVGWHLPTGGSDTAEFTSMVTAAGSSSAAIRKSPYNFLSLSGFWEGSAAKRRGEYSVYWSSTASSNSAVYRLYLYDTGTDSSLGKSNKFIGASVRCVADSPTASAGTIVYNSNGGSGDMSMVTHTSVSNNANVQLYAPNYWRSGYGFLGWSTDPQAESKIGTANAATIYGPQETITAPSDIATNGIILYAVWKKSEGNMQDWKGCSSMNIGDVTALTDTRDSDTYAVAKLADNKCWTIENLRLSSGTINFSNTHNPISSFVWTESTNSFCGTANASCIDRVELNTNNVNQSLAASPTANNNSSSWYSYGVNYNWHTATAGRGTYSMAGGSNATGDLCPLGWHLPTSGSNAEFVTMVTAAGNSSAAVRKYPYNYVLVGYYAGNSATYRGSSSYYLSSTDYNNGGTSAYYLYIDSSSISPSRGASKYGGFSVRCIAE